MDKIILANLSFWGIHGVLPQEKTAKQEFIVHAEIGADLQRALESDEIADTVDYGAIYAVVRQTVEEESYALLEALAGRMIAKILSFARVESVKVRVEKVKAPLMPQGAAAAVEIERSKACNGKWQ